MTDVRDIFLSHTTGTEASRIIPRTGQLQRLVFNEHWEELRREPMLMDLHQRLRDVRQGPDGLLYLLTAENDGALLRLEPR
jgi:glucose/arabinose dehydrogenase